MDQEKFFSQAVELAKSSKAQMVVGLFLAFKSLRKLNACYTKKTINNHVHDPTWDWSREIVVITGGSSGIGAVLVSRFAEKGVKVLILDRNAPPTELGKSRLTFKTHI